MVYSHSLCKILIFLKYVVFHLLHILLSHVPQGDREAACLLFENLLKEEKAKGDEASKSTVPYIAIHYANFLRLVYKDVTKGRAGKLRCGAFRVVISSTCP